MAAYRRVYDLRHLQADCQGPGSAPEPYVGQLSMGYLYLLFSRLLLGYNAVSIAYAYQADYCSTCSVVCLSVCL